MFSLMDDQLKLGRFSKSLEVFFVLYINKWRQKASSEGRNMSYVDFDEMPVSIM